MGGHQDGRGSNEIGNAGHDYLKTQLQPGTTMTRVSSRLLDADKILSAREKSVRDSESGEKCPDAAFRSNTPGKCTHSGT